MLDSQPGDPEFESCSHLYLNLKPCYFELLSMSHDGTICRIKINDYMLKCSMLHVEINTQMHAVKGHKISGN